MPKVMLLLLSVLVTRHPPLSHAAYVHLRSRLTAL